MATEEKKKINCDYQYREILNRRKPLKIFRRLRRFRKKIEEFDLKDTGRNEIENPGSKERRIKIESGMGSNEEQSENGPLDIRNDFEMVLEGRCPAALTCWDF